METELTVPVPVPVPLSSSSPPPHDHDDSDHPDLSTVGSPDITDSHFAPPSDDLRLKIIKQVEYYFSDENLLTDKFLMKYVTKDEGFVPIGVIASFRKLKKLTRDASLIVTALRESSLLVVSSNGKKVKRSRPLPFTELKDPELCTVLVENLPEDHSVENLQRIFGEVGNVKHISVREPHSVKEPRKCTVAEKLVSGKLHALVEYDNVEAAEKAVDTLNNEHDWRFGLRVKLLKKMIKPGQKKKAWREADPEKSCSVKASVPAVHNEKPRLSDQHDDTHDKEEDGEQFLKKKNGESPPEEKIGHRGRNRGRGRRQDNHGPNGHGQGTHSISHNFEPAKPPPGPRMPDGTKGFSMGRGRPLVETQS